MKTFADDLVFSILHACSSTGLDLKTRAVRAGVQFALLGSVTIPVRGVSSVVRLWSKLRPSIQTLIRARNPMDGSSSEAVLDNIVDDSCATIDINYFGMDAVALSSTIPFNAYH